MKAKRFILVRNGCLADGRGSGAYQIYEKMAGDAPVYELYQGVQNDPVNLNIASCRLAMLESGETHA